MNDIEAAHKKFADDVQRVQAGIRLDISLEKGRIRDEARAQEVEVEESLERSKRELEKAKSERPMMKYSLYTVSQFCSHRPIINLTVCFSG